MVTGDFVSIEMPNHNQSLTAGTTRVFGWILRNGIWISHIDFRVVSSIETIDFFSVSAAIDGYAPRNEAEFLSMGGQLVGGNVTAVFTSISNFQWRGESSLFRVAVNKPGLEGTFLAVALNAFASNTVLASVCARLV